MQVIEHFSLTPKLFLSQRFEEISGNFKAQAKQKSFTNIAFIGTLFHISFTFLFFILDIPWLSALNVISSLLWASTFYLIDKKHFSFAVYIMLFEVIIHAVIATKLMGSQYGFHFYLLPAMGFFIIAPNVKVRLAILFSFAMILIFLSLSMVQYESFYIIKNQNVGSAIFALNVILSLLPFMTTIATVKIKREVGAKQLFEQSFIDDYTHTYNRRFVYQYISKGLSHPKYVDTPLTLILADIDNFKTINDEHGYDVGEEVILNIVAVFKRFSRDIDVIARWSGQEFLLVMPELPTTQMIDFLESVQFGISLQDKPKQNMNEVTVSFGVSNASNILDFAQALQRSDMNLNKAKQRGKNQYIYS